jgi:hypothetical protein
MRRRSHAYGHFPIIGAALLLLGGRTSAQSSQRDDSPFGVPPWGCEATHYVADSPHDYNNQLIDAAHPKYFTRVVEVTMSGRRRLVYSYWIDTAARPSPAAPSRSAANAQFLAQVQRRACERVNADVDVRSRIVVEFDRAWLINQYVEASMTVAGNLQTGSSSPRIEIPGYSEVGKDIPSASPIRRADRLAGIARDFLTSWEELRAQLDTARSQSDRQSRAAREAGVAEALEARDSAVARRDRAMALTAGDSAARERAQVAVDSAEARLRATRRTSSYIETLDTAYVIRARRLLILRRSQLETPLKTLADTASPYLLRALAQQGNADANTARALVTEIGTVFDAVSRPLPPVTDANFRVQGREAADSIEKMTILLARMARFIELGVGRGTSFAYMLSSLSRVDDPKPYAIALMADLRDAEILLRQIGAKPGESVVLHIADSVPGATGRRQLDVRMRIRELGLVRRVSDAVLLLRRQGVNAELTDPRLDAARLAFKATGRADPVEDVPLEANFIPAAGATLAWTYYERSGGGWMSLVDWLTPGFGVNVSFTSFPSKTVSFSAPDAAGAPPRETVTLAQDKLQVSAGPVITLFDNAIVIGAGWNLNVSRQRFYTAIGFSFVNVAKRLGLSTEEANSP